MDTTEFITIIIIFVICWLVSMMNLIYFYGEDFYNQWKRIKLLASRNNNRIHPMPIAYGIEVEDIPETSIIIVTKEDIP